MQTYSFIINGLRHHDFGQRLEELYGRAMGSRMSVSIERENPQEAEAVIVYWGSRCVGYVRSGADRARACALIEASGRKSLLGRIVGVDSRRRWLRMEVMADCCEEQLAAAATHHPDPLSGWSYEGRILPAEEACHRLHALLDNLQQVAEAAEPWDEDVEEWLCYVEDSLWRDISREVTRQVGDILCALTWGAERQAAYQEKACRLQLAIDRMGSPEVRRRQLQHLAERARTPEMDELLMHYADRASEAVARLSPELRRLFLADGEQLMGRLWYLHLSSRQVEAILTLLALELRLRKQPPALQEPCQHIACSWLLEWGARQMDDGKREVVRQILSAYDLEQHNPQLAGQLLQMEQEHACQGIRITHQDIHFDRSVGQVVAHAGQIVTNS